MVFHYPSFIIGAGIMGLATIFWLWMVNYTKEEAER